MTGHDKRGRIYRTDTTMGKTTRGVSISADLVEEIVVESVLEASDRIKLQEPEKESPFALVEELEEQYAFIAGLYASGEMPAPAFNDARITLQARIKEARKSVTLPTSLNTDWGTKGQLRADWESPKGLTLAQKRSAIEAFVEQIVILPAHGEGRKTAAARVTIPKWKVPKLT